MVGFAMNRILPATLILLFSAAGCSILTAPPAADTGWANPDVSDLDASQVTPDAGNADGGANPLADAGPSDSGLREGCSEDDHCTDDERCSYLGICHSQECVGHPDCNADQRCLDGQCLARPTSEQGIIFERYFTDHLRLHNSLLPSGTIDRNTSIESDFGFGAALFDIDADQDLDLFVGVQNASLEGGSPPCIFRNESQGSSPRFTPIPEFCATPGRSLNGGFGFDMEGDGFHELVVTGSKIVELWRFHPRPEVINLLALLDPTDERGDCNAGAAVNIDLDFDGLLDLVVGCHYNGVDEQGLSAKHLAFVQDGNGSFRSLQQSSWAGDPPLLLVAQSSTVALGATDLNDDGLIDLIAAEDFYTKPPGLEADSGGVYLRCDPRNLCKFRPFRLGVGHTEHGGFMGAGVLQVEGRGELLYMTDLGTNRMVQVSGERPRDFARTQRAELGFNQQMPMFSWSVIVDDFNRDGHDDLLVSQGAGSYMSSREYGLHYQALLLQNEQGHFTTHSEEVGLQPYSTQDSGVAEYPFSARGMLRADFDNDGFIDIIELGIEGFPRLHRELPLNGAAPRCSIIPRPRYVPGFGVGHALIPPGGGAARRWDVQGQIQSGTTPYLLSPWRQGKLRFPSGAEVEFDCGERHSPLTVVEPAWLSVDFEADQLNVGLHAGTLDGPLSALLSPSGELHAMVPAAGAQMYTLALPEGTEAVMLRFGERWLARWWRP
jgi:hypothetical protein